LFTYTPTTSVDTPAEKRREIGINEQNKCGVSIKKKNQKKLNITYSTTPGRNSYMVLCNQN
jgi:hypothetical protein